MAQVDAVSLTLPAEPESVRQARRFLAETVTAWIADPTDLLLATSELVSNVVIHAQSPDVTVTVRQGPPIRVEIHDGVAATDTFCELIQSATMPDASSRTGRGIALVRAIASRIGLDDDPGGGKVVWFEYEDPPTHNDTAASP